MKKAIAGILYTLFVILAVVIAPSLLTFIIAILFVFIISDLRSKRFYHYVRTMNGAIRVVVGQGDGLEKVIAAFSRSGPLKWQCYEYLQRLKAGQDPIQAAAVSQVPLELATAIAIRLPQREEMVATGPAEASSRGIRSSDRFDPDPTVVPIYGQFIYLILTTLFLVVVTRFQMIFIFPTMEKMLEEFSIATGSSIQSLPAMASPRVIGLEWLLLGLLLCIFFATLLLTRGRMLRIVLPNWFPATPRDAQTKSDLLTGLAEAIEMGLPLEQALSLGQALSTNSNQQSDFRELILQTEKGIPPAIAMQNSGWINHREADWLAGAHPPRFAELLRTIADQKVRDANENASWFMELFFPAAILVLGAIVMAYSVGFFNGLTEMIKRLA